MLQSNIAPWRPKINARRCVSAMTATGRRLTAAWRRPAQRPLLDRQHGDKPDRQEHRAGREHASGTRAAKSAAGHARRRAACRASARARRCRCRRARSRANAATMMAPPSWRAKLSAPVAVPSWCGCTAFWIDRRGDRIHHADAAAADRQQRADLPAATARRAARRTRASIDDAEHDAADRHAACSASSRTISRPANERADRLPDRNTISAVPEPLGEKPSTSSK